MNKIIFERYMISDAGTITSLIGGGKKILKDQPSADGCRKITLSVARRPRIFMVHKLVADAFVPNPDGKKLVRHIDGNKQNNNASNLRWLTASEMMQEDWQSGKRTMSESQREALKKPRKKEAKQKVRMVRHIATQQLYETITDACKALGLDKDVYLYRRGMDRPLIDFEYFWVTL
jgi:hypothetical protein